jgi:hypothetical protein
MTTPQRALCGAIRLAVLMTRVQTDHPAPVMSLHPSRALLSRAVHIPQGRILKCWAIDYVLLDRARHLPVRTQVHDRNARRASVSAGS